jgi:TatA/E family protein of Tat protein translocase
MLGTTEWIVIGSIAVLLFGAPKIIQWAKALGQAKREFKEAEKEVIRD